MRLTIKTGSVTILMKFYIDNYKYRRSANMDDKIIEYFKVFSDKNRLEIIELLLKGETCGCTLIDKVPISQPTLSYHLKTITVSGLATSKREGNWIKHYIDKEKINDMIRFLEQLRDTEAEVCNL
jgi:ArsR family transcriptional regulator